MSGSVHGCFVILSNVLLSGKEQKKTNKKLQGGGKKVLVEEKVQGEIWKSKAPLSYLSIFALKALLHLEVSVV